MRPTGPTLTAHVIAAALLHAAVVVGMVTGLAAGARAETLVVAAVETPKGFDGDALKPATQNVVTQVYEGLTKYAYKKDEQGRTVIDGSRVVPHLAESWTVSEDGRTYVFKLRRGVRSPFGNELTAEDVVWGWEKSFAQKRTGNFIARVSSVAKVDAVSRYEVKFTLEAPSLIFLRALTLYTPGIYDSTEMKKHATPADPWALKWLEGHTAGFGAYHLESLRAGEAAVFVANPNYFKGKPFFDRVVYREVPSAASRVTLLKAGQVQWTEALTLKQVVDLRKDPRVKVESDEATGHASVRMNARYEPFDDVRVRRALLYAADYDALNEAVFEGLGTQARSIVPPIIEGHDGSAWTYKTDVAKAKRLLAESGHPDGIDLTLEYSDIFWWEEPLAIQLKGQLGRAGIRAQLKRITSSEMRSRTAPGKRDLPFFTFQDNPIVLDPVYALFINAHAEGASNRNDYRNLEFDRLVDLARVEQDRDRRNDLVRRAQRLHVEDATWVMTLYPGAHEAMARCIEGYVWQPDYHERWAELRCRK
jgi:ABC-type transport system substrate-binding protein